MHTNGIAHRDLFAKHIFIKKEGKKVDVQPIDLERTFIKGQFPGSEFFFFIQKVRDLAVLFLTTPWPKVSSSERLKFYLAY